MATERVKLDYNNFMHQLCDYIDNKSDENDLSVFGLAMGLQLLTSYLKNIAERAIELNDEVLIGLLKDLCVVKEDGGDTE